MKLDEDQSLIKDILKGDKRSFEKLMKKYNRRIYNFIYRMIRDEESSIELSQEFFIKIYTVMYKYNFQYKFSTWAYRICYNLVIDHIRKNQVKIDSLDGKDIKQKQILDHTGTQLKDGYHNLEKEEIKTIVWDVVDTIPVKYRELILLRYMQGLKYDEIAEFTDLPVGTVKNRIFKAKEILKMEMLKNEMFKE
ncbi:MAG: sigma-70 family RNA polymerase sigma factor [Acidobacteriota bacterium]